MENHYVYQFCDDASELSIDYFTVTRLVDGPSCRLLCDSLQDFWTILNDSSSTVPYICSTLVVRSSQKPDKKVLEYFPNLPRKQRIQLR